MRPGHASTGHGQIAFYIHTAAPFHQGGGGVHGYFGLLVVQHQEYGTHEQHSVCPAAQDIQAPGERDQLREPHSGAAGCLR